jgi:hypothetical protein
MAARWYRRAAERGHTKAQRQMGTLLWRGQGVSEERREAAHWWSTAARQGDSLAKYYTGMLLVRGALLPRDLRTGWSYLYAAAQDKDAWAQVLPDPLYGAGARRILLVLLGTLLLAGMLGLLAMRAR